MPCSDCQSNADRNNLPANVLRALEEREAKNEAIKAYYFKRRLYDLALAKRLHHVTALLCNLCEIVDLSEVVELKGASETWFRVHQQLDTQRKAETPASEALLSVLQRQADKFAKTGKL